MKPAPQTEAPADLTAVQKAAMRLLSLKAPGVYDLTLIVSPDGSRMLVVKNAGRPHPLEYLGSK